MVIYKITNSINDKIYIGQTTTSLEKRFRGHLGDMEREVNNKFYNAMKKHGAENFYIEPIEIGINSLESLSEREVFWIRYYDTYNNGYNSTEGGEISPMMYASVRTKVSNALKGRVFSDEHRQKLSLANLGKEGVPHTEEHKSYMRELMIGREVSEETREKLRKASLGKTQSKETIEKRMKYVRGVSKSKEHTMKLAKILNENRFVASGADSPISIAVDQIDKNTNKVLKRFETISDAETSLGVKRGTGAISRAISGERKTAYGYKWENAIMTVMELEKMNEKLKKEVDEIIKTTNIVFKLSLLIMALALAIASISAYSYKVDKDNKIAMLEQNEEYRIENQRLVDKNNDIIKEFEKLRSTLDYINYEKAFTEALVNTTFNYETGYGTSTMWLEQNNAGGIKGYYSGGYLTYESQIHGLTHLESLLRDKYINTYGHDIIAIRKAYDPNYTEEQLQEFVHMFKLELERILNNE